ncbi:MAG: glycoside hydrolase family 78 protein [Lachnospiraceae bacterium]|nr:glycoside hydrolase family 78 protein [Lachnospiraceae bacterium]
MIIQNVRINGIENPKGFLYKQLDCSWEVTETDSKKQVSASIEVSGSETFEDIIYKKEGAGLKQGGEPLEMELRPRTVYYYRVAVYGDAGDNAVSGICHFETGKMNEPWQAKWIGPEKRDSFHPVLGRRFTLRGQVKRARLYVTGVGLFEASLNGEKLGQEFLAPYLNNYEKHIQVLTFSVEKYLKQENTLEILLGKGWYMGVFGMELQAENYGDRMSAIAELHLEYTDGSEEVVGTDENWEYYGSDIEDSGIYSGEILNRQLWENRKNERKAVEVLGMPGQADEGQNDGKVAVTAVSLMDRMSLPVLAKETIFVKDIFRTPAGELVLDMGQNFAGFVEFIADFPTGTRIELDFGEILQGGNFYRENYRQAKSRFVYVSNGEKEAVRPHFTYFGFRYVRVSGWPGECRKEDFVGKALYSDLSRTGYITTSHKKINQLYSNTLWGLKSNFLDIPTDCPQRDERLGWTGDAQVFAPTACYHMDTRAFYHKFIKDLRDEQQFLDGGVPNYLPNFGHRENVGSIWGDIAALLPQTLYTYYGNLGEMEYCYPLMKDWVDYIDQKDAARGRQYLYNFGFTFGDWLALDGTTASSFKGNTDDSYLASLYYCHSVQIVKEMAERLGKAEDAAHYAQLERLIRQAVYDEYFSKSGRLAIDTQSAYVAALKFNICPDRERVTEQFKVRLKKDGYQIKCGFAGAPLLCMALAEAGLYELAYDFLLNEQFPGWLYCVGLGATTVWERWNSVLPDGSMNPAGMNSLNHYSYGAVMEFVYAYVGGIRSMEPGFKRAIIAPWPDVRIGKVDCTYHSVNGKYRCAYEILPDGQMHVQVEIPFNCEAETELPAYAEGKMTLSAGNYEFTYTPVRDFRKPYHPGTPLKRLAQDAKAVEILGKYVPAYAGIAKSGDLEMGASTLMEMSFNDFIPCDRKKLAAAMQEIENIVVAV